MIPDDQTRAKIYKMLSLKSFVGERNDLLKNTMVDFDPMERLENM